MGKIAGDDGRRKKMTCFGRTWDRDWDRIPRKLLRGMRAGTKMNQKFSVEGSLPLIGVQ